MSFTLFRTWKTFSNSSSTVGPKNSSDLTAQQHNVWWEKSIMRDYNKVFNDHKFMNTKAFWSVKVVIHFVYNISWAVPVVYISDMIAQQELFVSTRKNETLL